MAQQKAESPPPKRPLPWSSRAPPTKVRGRETADPESHLDYRWKDDRSYAGLWSSMTAKRPSDWGGLTLGCHETWQKLLGYG